MKLVRMIPQGCESAEHIEHGQDDLKYDNLEAFKYLSVLFFGRGLKGLFKMLCKQQTIKLFRIFHLNLLYRRYQLKVFYITNSL